MTAAREPDTGRGRSRISPADLRAWRTARKLSQQRLASLLGVTWLAVQRWEAGTRKVPAFLGLALKGLESEL